MYYNEEQRQKIKNVLTQINDFTKTIPLEEEFILKDPFNHWRFKISSSGKRANIILENDKFSPSSLDYVLSHDTINFYTNEIEYLINDWGYIKLEIKENSAKQIERKEKLNERLDTFKI